MKIFFLRRNESWLTFELGESHDILAHMVINSFAEYKCISSRTNLYTVMIEEQKSILDKSWGNLSRKTLYIFTLVFYH